MRSDLTGSSERARREAADAGESRQAPRPQPGQVAVAVGAAAVAGLAAVGVYFAGVAGAPFIAVLHVLVIAGAAAAGGWMVARARARDRERYETERRLSAQLRTRALVRTALLRTLGHDLRTPLTSVAGFTKTLIDHDLPVDMQQHLLERMKYSLDRIAHLLDDLLDADRNGNGEGSLRLRDVELQDVAVRAADSCGIDPGRLEFVTNPVTVRADAGLLERAIANLVGNAAKYSPPGTPVTVRVAEYDGTARVSVEDRGSGIAPSQRERLFDPYVRGDHDGAAGSGLGLHLVATFVELHGGSVAVEAREPVGTRVHVDLPLRPPGAAGRPIARGRGSVSPRTSR